MRQDLERAAPLLTAFHRVAGEDLLELLYVTYASHFAVDFSSRGSTDVTEILARGDGTCWQQALVATEIGNALGGSYITCVTDPEQMGHTVSVTESGILDVSNNLVLFVDPRRWRDWPAWRRLQAMEEQSCFGVHRE